MRVEFDLRESLNALAPSSLIEILNSVNVELTENFLVIASTTSSLLLQTTSHIDD